MAHILRILDINKRRALRRERIFRDRNNPLDTYSDGELIQAKGPGIAASLHFDRDKKIV